MVVRRAMRGDELGVASVHVRAWQAAYRTLIPDAYLDSLLPADRASKYTFGTEDPLKPVTFVGVQDGVIRGFATITDTRESGASARGEVAALYVDPSSWGQGVGRTLIAAARAALLDLGFRSAILWVLRGNLRADRFYRADGWLPDGTVRTDTVWSVTVDEIRYQRSL